MDSWIDGEGSTKTLVQRDFGDIVLRKRSMTSLSHVLFIHLQAARGVEEVFSDFGFGRRKETRSSSVHRRYGGMVRRS